MSKYKELKANYDKLAKSYCDAITEIQKYKTQLEELEKNNKQLMNNSKYEKMRLDQLIGISSLQPENLATIRPLNSPLSRRIVGGRPCIFMERN